MVRILGIDYGDKRVGLAISDPDELVAVVKGFVDNKGEESLLNELRQIVEESDVSRVVFGLPLHLSGEESESSGKVRAFARKVADELKVSLDFQDERFSTYVSSQPIMMEKKKYRRKKVLRDIGAAVIILQTYLDRKSAKMGGGTGRENGGRQRKNSDEC